MELIQKNLTPRSAPQEEDGTDAIVERLGLLTLLEEIFSDYR
jgi:hypothetical protein